jgi:hypothetical protein
MRRLGTIVQALLALILVLYAGDYAVYRYRASHGTAFKTLQVDQYLSTPLKGNKAEYDYMGTQAETCSRSLFPQAGDPPCWWLARHTSRWE